MPEALEIAGGYLERSNVECLAVDEGSLRLAFDLLECPLGSVGGESPTRCW